MRMNKTIVLNSRPIGKPKLSDFKSVGETMPELAKDQVLLKSIYVSVDPYLRGRMNDVKSYIPPFELQKPMGSGTIAEVIASKNKDFKAGDFVMGMLDWKEQQLSNGEGLLKVDPKKAPLSA